MNEFMDDPLGLRVRRNVNGEADPKHDHFESWVSEPACQAECEPGECPTIPGTLKDDLSAVERETLRRSTMMAALEIATRPASALPENDAQRGLYPMAEGCLDYFPNALAEVSRISYEGNQKHNPGEPMHWSRGKSTDHRNKIIRHTVDSRPDTELAIEHAAQAAWRALAVLQEKIERVRGVPLAPGAKPA